MLYLCGTLTEFTTLDGDLGIDVLLSIAVAGEHASKRAEEGREARGKERKVTSRHSYEYFPVMCLLVAASGHELSVECQGLEIEPRGIDAGMSYTSHVACVPSKLSPLPRNMREWAN